MAHPRLFFSILWFLTTTLLLLLPSTHARDCGTLRPRAEVICYLKSLQKDILVEDLCKCSIMVLTEIELDEFFRVQASIDPATLSSLKQRNPYIKFVISLGGQKIPDEVFVQLSSTVEGVANFSESVTRYLIANSLDGVEVNWQWPRADEDKKDLSVLIKVLRFSLDLQEKRILEKIEKVLPKEDYRPPNSSFEGILERTKRQLRDENADHSEKLRFSRPPFPAVRGGKRKQNREREVRQIGSARKQHQTPFRGTTKFGDSLRVTPRMTTFENRGLARRRSAMASVKRGRSKIMHRMPSFRKKVGQRHFIMLRLPPSPERLVKGSELKELVNVVDLFVMSTHNFTAIRSNKEEMVTFHPSRLMGVSDIQNADSMTDFLVSFGIPLDKLVLGIPSTVASFDLENPDISSPGSPSKDYPSFFSYTKLCLQLEEGHWTEERDQDLTAPFVFANSTWIAFDDPLSVKIKLSRSPRRAVLRSLVNDLTRRTRSSFEAENLHHSPFRIVRVVDRNGNIRSERITTDSKFECSRQGYYRDPEDCSHFYRCVKFDQYADDFTVFEYACPKGLVFDEKWEVCSWPLAAASCEGSSEIFPVPRRKNVCDRNGYFTDPENCRWFFACKDYYGNGTYFQYDFRCPYGLAFDEENIICNWPWLVSKCSENLPKSLDEKTGRSLTRNGKTTSNQGNKLTGLPHMDQPRTNKEECLDCGSSRLIIGGKGILDKEKGIIIAENLEKGRLSYNYFKETGRARIPEDQIRSSFGVTSNLRSKVDFGQSRATFDQNFDIDGRQFTSNNHEIRNQNSFANQRNLAKTLSRSYSDIVDNSRSSGIQNAPLPFIKQPKLLLSDITALSNRPPTMETKKSKAPFFLNTQKEKSGLNFDFSNKHANDKLFSNSNTADNNSNKYKGNLSRQNSGRHIESTSSKFLLSNNEYHQHSKSEGQNLNKKYFSPVQFSNLRTNNGASNGFSATNGFVDTLPLTYSDEGSQQVYNNDNSKSHMEVNNFHANNFQSSLQGHSAVSPKSLEKPEGLLTENSYHGPLLETTLKNNKNVVERTESNMARSEISFHKQSNRHFAKQTSSLRSHSKINDLELKNNSSVQAEETHYGTHHLKFNTQQNPSVHNNVYPTILLHAESGVLRSPENIQFSSGKTVSSLNLPGNTQSMNNAEFSRQSIANMASEENIKDGTKDNLKNFDHSYFPSLNFNPVSPAGAPNNGITISHNTSIFLNTDFGKPFTEIPDTTHSSVGTYKFPVTSVIKSPVFSTTVPTSAKQHPSILNKHFQNKNFPEAEFFDFTGLHHKSSQNSPHTTISSKSHKGNYDLSLRDKFTSSQIAIIQHTTIGPIRGNLGVVSENPFGSVSNKPQSQKREKEKLNPFQNSYLATTSDSPRSFSQTRTHVSNVAEIQSPERLEDVPSYSILNPVLNNEYSLNSKNIVKNSSPLQQEKEHKSSDHKQTITYSLKTVPLNRSSQTQNTNLFSHSVPNKEKLALQHSSLLPNTPSSGSQLPAKQSPSLSPLKSKQMDSQDPITFSANSKKSFTSRDNHEYTSSFENPINNNKRVSHQRPRNQGFSQQSFNISKSLGNVLQNPTHNTLLSHNFAVAKEFPNNKNSKRLESGKSEIGGRFPLNRNPPIVSKLTGRRNFQRFGPGGFRNFDDAIGPEVCQRPGLFRHPDNCDQFYECYWDKWIQKFTLHVFNCPVTIIYDSGITACNWPFNGPPCTDGIHL